MADFTTQRLGSQFASSGLLGYSASKTGIGARQGAAGSALESAAFQGPQKVMDSNGGFSFANVQTGQDLVKSMIADRKAEISAVEEDEARQREAQAKIGQGTDLATQGLRKTAQESLGRSDAQLSQFKAESGANVAEIQQRSRELADTARARRAEDIAATEAQQYSIMQGFKDETASAIQSQRIANKANMETEIDNIMQQAAAQGLDSSDPAVQAQVQKVRASAIQSAGEIASQASMQYNTAKAQLGSAMASLDASVRQATSAAAGRGEEQAVAGLVSAGQLQQQTDDALIAARSKAESDALQVFAMADQLEFSGRLEEANFMRNMTSSYSPLAPIVAASMVEGENLMNKELGAWAATPAPEIQQPSSLYSQQGRVGGAAFPSVAKGVGGARSGYSGVNPLSGLSTQDATSRLQNNIQIG